MKKNIIFILVVSGLLSSCRTKSKLSKSTFINNQKILEVPPHYKLDLPEPILEPKIEIKFKEETALKPKHKFFWSKEKSTKTEKEVKPESIKKVKPKHRFFWSKKQEIKKD